jgi:hypothetical protein
MEGKMEIVCKNGKLSMEAKENIKINAKTTMGLQAGGNVDLEASSSAKVTSAQPTNIDAQSIDIA